MGNRYKLFLILIACILLLPVTGMCQPEKITVNFNDSLFKQFVVKVEAQSPYHFFYDPEELDTLKIRIETTGKPLNEILQEIFRNTAFTFAIDSLHDVFVFNKRFVVSTSLAEFYKAGKRSGDSSGNILADTISEQGKPLLQTSIENKLFEIGQKNSNVRGKVTLAGYIKDSRNGEPLAGSVIYIESARLNVVSDQFGYYSLSIPAGRYELLISSAGMKTTRRQIILHSDGKLNVEMAIDIPTLKTVFVTAERNSNIKRMQMGVEKLEIRTIKQVPVLFGETDVLRVIQTLPGVTSVGEGSTGFNVRGGSADQNLVLYNDATIYNPSHFFGFFSAFNPDVVRNVELYKASVPEKYGGRLSSVLNVTGKDGNNKKFSGVGGIGLLTSKLTVEGPIIKNKTSFILGGRTTYSNWLLSKIPGDDFKNSRASFYDLDLHISHFIDDRNTIYLTGYLSKDKFRLNSDSLYRYGNSNLIVKWKHIFTNRLNVSLSAGKDHYKYSIEGNSNLISGYKLNFSIDQLNARADFNYTTNKNHQVDFGLSTIKYSLSPGNIDPFGKESLVRKDNVAPEYALESAVYAGDQFNINQHISINAGIRYSIFNYLGPGIIYHYIKGLPKDPVTVTDSSKYGAGKIINTYHGPEIRFSLRYTLNDSSSLKFSFNTLRQYIHLISNTTAVSPTDTWKLSDPNIKPQFGEQVSIGFYRNFKSNTIETSLELYYKKFFNFLDYKSGAILVMNHHIETDVIDTKGQAYGAELLIKKLAGKLNGWISYTLSRTELIMDDSTSGQVINKGKAYPANFDKPHNLNVIGNYRFSHRYSVSLNMIYSTGRPITLPIAIFYLAGSQRLFYSERNQYRIPDYFRMDFSVNIEGNHKVKKLTHNSWSVGIYNITARKNPYSIYFLEEGGQVKGYKLSVIGTAIPYVTYNFRF